jgi:hypothetical protein
MGVQQASLTNTSNKWVWVVIVGLMLFLVFRFANSPVETTEVTPSATPETVMEISEPESVVVDAGTPLSCTLLAESKTIGATTATYSCQAPGAFLTGVDTSTDPWTAGYFTTNSSATEVTYGPETVTAAPGD